MRQLYIDLRPWCDRCNFVNLLRIFILHPTFRAVVMNRLGKKQKGLLYVMCKIYSIHLRNKYHIDIPLTANIGNSPMFPHEGPILMNAYCNIGDNVTIFPGTMIGASVRGKGGKQIIGNNVVICGGAKIIGAITIPDNVFIAPNTVVVKDQEPNTTIAGVPSRVISMNGAQNCRFYSYNRF